MIRPIQDTFENNINDREIVVIGCKRSGHHGIIAWLRYLLEGRVLHINCVNLLERIYERQFAVTVTNKNIQNCIWNIEEFKLTENTMDKISSFNAGASNRVDHILVVRDPFNMIASRIQYGGLEYEYSEGNLDPYFSHIRELSGITHHIPNCICINFNQWFSSQKYRQSIAKKLNLSFNDKGLNLVDNNGSSFDSFNYHCSGQQMKVTERYLKLMKETRYVIFFRRHPELFEIGKNIFGMEVIF